MIIRRSVWEKNYLYPTFDNPRKAMNNVKKEANEFLDVIAAEYSLDELSDKNWEDLIFVQVIQLFIYEDSFVR